MISDRMLSSVTKPARYIGGEWNSTSQDWNSARVRVALAFPDIYEVGMSNLAIPILYEILNNMPGVIAERVYAPWPDMEAILRENSIPLTSLETRHALHEFDILGFSLGYELSYPTVLNMLDLGGIPLYSQERKESWPLVIAGGGCTCNPEPLADFIDAFLLGEAEDFLSPLINTCLSYKGHKPAILRQLAKLQGVYIPQFYQPHYNPDGTLSSLEPSDQAPARVTRCIATRLIPAVKPVVPHIEVIHDRGAIELQRGCTRGCRFCQAGMLYRPIRKLAKQEVIQAADCLLENCGYNTLALVSLSSGDYPGIDDLVKTMSENYAGRGITISLPSLRLDRSSIDLISAMPSGRKTTLTFAPEAGSERLRNSINKPLPHESIMETFAAAFERNWLNLKLYFMIGLPTETIEDIEAIIDLAKATSRLGRSIRGKSCKLRITVSSFVPKAQTPCQWSAQDEETMLVAKHHMLQQNLHKSGIQLSWHDPKTSFLEAVLARGDRRLGKVIYSAWRKGSRLDTWNELFDFKRWQQAFDECQVDPRFYALRQRDTDELLPWSHLSAGVSIGFLRSEQRKMLTGELTTDCRTGDCNVCGLQNSFPACKERAEHLKYKGKFDLQDETG